MNESYEKCINKLEVYFICDHILPKSFNDNNIYFYREDCGYDTVYRFYRIHKGVINTDKSGLRKGKKYIIHVYDYVDNSVFSVERFGSELFIDREKCLVNFMLKYI